MNRQVNLEGKSLPSPAVSILGDKLLDILGGDPTRITNAYSAINVWHSLGASDEFILDVARTLARRKGWTWRGFAYLDKVMQSELKLSGIRQEPDEFGIVPPKEKPPGWHDYPRWRRYFHIDHVAWQESGRFAPKPDRDAYERAGGRPEPATIKAAERS